MPLWILWLVGLTALSARPVHAASATAVPTLSPSQAASLLYPQADRDSPLGPDARRALAACQAGDPAGRIRCLIRGRYSRDRAAARLVERIFDRSGAVVGLEPARKMHGGWRGHLTLVPVLPVGRWRRHLVWIAAAMDTFDGFFTALSKEAGRRRRVVRYRWRALAFRFFQSVGKRTPSAYADHWTVAWNVNGSLLTSAQGSAETLFHEVFHLNDAEHKSWSQRALATAHQAIVTRCTRGRGRRATLSNSCLSPYAPHRTKVRGQTYYAFHPESDAGEYAAELAVRYFQEQLAAQAGRAPRAPFKCRTPENQRAYAALAAEFFGGVDLLGACATPPP